MAAPSYRIELLYGNGTVRTFLRGLTLSCAEKVRWQLFNATPNRDYFVVRDPLKERGASAKT